MKPEEITLTDDLKQPPPWNLWVKEHWGFLVVIGGLSVISFFFLIRDLFYSSPRHIEKFDLELTEKRVRTFSEREVRSVGRYFPERASATLPARKGNISPHTLKYAKEMYSPLSPAKILFQRGEIDLAISSLLKLARRHPNSNVREKAARLAKKYNQLRTQKRELKQKYLKGYVLFTTHPKEACKTWREIIKNERPEEPYYRKAKKRFEENCLNEDLPRVSNSVLAPH